MNNICQERTQISIMHFIRDIKGQQVVTEDVTSATMAVMGLGDFSDNNLSDSKFSEAYFPTPNFPK